MFTKQEIKHMVFFDVETATEYSSFKELKKKSPNLAKAWSKRCEWLRDSYEDNKDKTDEELYEYKGALHPEFNRVLCVSFGRVEIDDKGKINHTIKTYKGDDEKEILEKTLKVFEKFINSGFKFTGHNIKGFDIPVLLKRSVINSLNIPKCLHLHHLKPWDFPFLDTGEVWSFGSWKNGLTSLDLLSTALGIPTPKEDMNGSMVSDAYWKEGKLDEIAEYCERDVIATANAILRLGNFQLIKKRSKVAAV
jgi:predicted PolB exonuclease-like 3'-5' exonuclease